MFCKQCQEILSDYIDGDVELGEQVKIESHLADCEPCRAVRDDLLQIVHFSKQLPEHAPSPALWARIQVEVAEGQPKTLLARAGQWWARLRTRHFNLTVPQMAAAAAALLVVIAIGVVLTQRDAAAPQAANIAGTGGARLEVKQLSNPEVQHIEAYIDSLSHRIEERKTSWNPELRDAFERNMYYIEQSLAECRHQLSDDPTDDVSQELMLNAYREKVRLLEGFTNF